jgi:hypothetical protein
MLAEEVIHITSGKEAGKQKLLCLKGMTSVKQNNDTALNPLAATL